MITYSKRIIILRETGTGVEHNFGCNPSEVKKFSIATLLLCPRGYAFSNVYRLVYQKLEATQLPLCV